MKTVDSQVIAGTINAGNGSLRLRVTAVGEDTTLSGIMRLVDEALQSKSQTQLLADKGSVTALYAAVLVALLAGVIWSIYYGSVTAQVVAIVVTILVIACPHALGLAVPSWLLTQQRRCENGILIRDRRAMETAKDVDVIVFDKTGTLTRAEIGVAASVVTDMLAADGRWQSLPLWKAIQNIPLRVPSVNRPKSDNSLSPRHQQIRDFERTGCQSRSQ